CEKAHDLGGQAADTKLSPMAPCCAAAQPSPGASWSSATTAPRAWLSEKKRARATRKARSAHFTSTLRKLERYFLPPANASAGALSALSVKTPKEKPPSIGASDARFISYTRSFTVPSGPHSCAWTAPASNRPSTAPARMIVLV